jgi:diguanylate cyclase (GGDEF)-like protein
MKGLARQAVGSRPLEGMTRMAPQSRGEHGRRSIGSPLRPLPTTSTDPPGRPEGAPRDPAAVPQSALSEIMHLLLLEDSPQRVLHAVASAMQDLIPHDTLTVYEADPVLRVHHPVLVRDRWAEEILAMGNIPYGAGVTGKVAESGQPQLVNDVHLDPRARQVPGTPVEAESLVAIPLIARGDLKGVLCLYRVGEQNHFSEEEFRLAIRFGELAALTLDNAQIRARLERDVVTDHLTGLFNHRYFQERLAEETRRANRRRTPLSLLVFDIDDFKRVNDTQGHLMGDWVLQSVAGITKESCRQEDLVCRIGGEEFGVILPGTTTEQGVALGDRLREVISSSALPVSERITVSIGVSEAPRDASGPRELFACADLALRQAKRAGKNRVLAFDVVDMEHAAGSSEEFSSDVRWEDEPSRRFPVLAARGELRSMAQLRMLQSLSTKLNRLNDVEEIGRTITAELHGLVDYHNCRVYLVEPDGETLGPIAFGGELSEYEGETYDALMVKIGEGITGRAAAIGGSVYTPNAAECDFAMQIPGTPDIEESILAVPLQYGDRVIGAVVLSKLGIDQFDDEDRRLLESLASNAAVSFENARLFQSEREARERLEQAYLSTVEALANALEAKDANTGDHAKALAQMSLAVGTELGLSGDGLKVLELAALFHDIGKIGVPTDIIRKPAPLTAAERREINRHPEIGEQILAPVAFLQGIRPIIRACHERWDGHGYPDGLRESEIPLESRIVFVCDAFHAMTSDRPYRASLGAKEAIRRLKLAAGTQFDRDVVESFVRLHERGALPPHREAREPRLVG